MSANEEAKMGHGGKHHAKSDLREFKNVPGHPMTKAMTAPYGSKPVMRNKVRDQH